MIRWMRGHDSWFENEVADHVAGWAANREEQSPGVVSHFRVKTEARRTQRLMDDEKLRDLGAKLA